MSRKKRIGYVALSSLCIGVCVIIVQSFFYQPAQSLNEGESYPIKQPTLVLAGIDSLTNGPIHLETKSRYLDDFIPKMHKVYGDGGPGYVPFDSIYFKKEHGDFHFSYGVHEINDLVPGQYPSQYSLDLKGMYTTRGYLHWMTVKMPSSWTWKYGEIFYLKQPGGGSFKVGYGDSKKMEKVDTDGQLKLGVIKLPANDHGSQLNFSHINGKVAIFGGLFLNDQGVAVSRIGQGGDRLAWHSRIDNNMMDQWLKQLKPSLFILNGGMNDRRSLTANQYQQDLLNYLAPFTREKCRLLLVAPNAIRGDNRRLKDYAMIMKQYASTHDGGFVSNRDALGPTYLIAQSKGYMGDWIHPNDLGSWMISQHLFNYLIHHEEYATLFHTKK